MPAEMEQDFLRDWVKRVNATWLEGRPEELSKYFHPEMIIAGVDFSPLATGREACIASYVDFLRQASVLDFADHELHTHVVGDTAVVGYGFAIDYKMHGADCQETGREVFILKRTEGTWLAIWRMLLFEKPG